MLPAVAMGRLSDETTPIPGMCDMGRIPCAMMGVLLEMGWAPPAPGGVTPRMALEDACPDP
jgi:hypothetical protein